MSPPGKIRAVTPGNGGPMAEHEDDEEQCAHREALLSGRSLTTGTGAPDVLVVEDDPEINELIAAYVQLAGFPCRRVMRGDDALREVTTRPPALIILDVMLPDIDGFEICRRLRADKRTAGLPVIILTALDQDQMRARTAACGAAEYITKPFDPEQLMIAIRRAASPKEPTATAHTS